MRVPLALMRDARRGGYRSDVSAANELTDAELRRLAQTTADEQTVLSVYVDLDPRGFAEPRGRQSEIDSLLDGAHREIESRELRDEVGIEG